jgi:hypothetical protein
MRRPASMTSWAGFDSIHRRSGEINAVDTLVQLQAKDFITISRPMLTERSRPLSEYELSSRRLDGLPLTDPINPHDFITDDERLHPRYESKLSNGTFKVRATLITVNRPKHGTWWEVRVGTRYRFTYRSVKHAARAFKALSAENLQPYGWDSNDGMPPTRTSNVLAEFGRLFGINAA